MHTRIYRFLIREGLQKVSTASERHAARRAIIEAERAERRREEEKRLAAKMQPKKSANFPAKWYWKGGIGIRPDKQNQKYQIPIRGFFYAGANMKDMIEPNIPEPSLINPKLSVAISSDGMEPLSPYPIYQLLSEEQRKGYIDFMASDRTTTDDIGFVFLYLYGLERRLIIDARKSNEVSDEERESIINELLRLLKSFGEQSDSLTHYIAMLLLYEGSVFETLSYDELDDIYGLTTKNPTYNAKTWENTDNAYAMSYMLASRLKEAGYDIPVKCLINLGKHYLLHNSSSFMNGIDEKELYEPAFEKLIYERTSFIDFSKIETGGARRLMDNNIPEYYASSPMIRKSLKPKINAAICPSPESLDIPVKKISDMVLTAYKEMQACKAVLDTTSIRDIDTVQLDALSACSPPRCALETSLTKTKSTATYISMQTIDDDLRRRFGQSVQYNSKGQMSLISQHLIAMSAASLGWQAILPETIDGLVSSSWRVDKDSRIVMFKRGIAHNKKNGKRCIGMIFGGDQNTFEFTIPGQWIVPSCLGYVYAWFISKCGDAFTRDDLFKFSSDYLPEITNTGIPNNQKSLFFSLLYATYSFTLSTHGIKQCLEMVPFHSVQDLVFSLVNDTYGRMIPPNVMSVLEDLYKKAGQDKAMVLYDYQSGSYNLHASTIDNFFIDEEKLADTIKDTSSVHDMLNEAIGSGEDEIMLGHDSSADDDKDNNDTQKNIANGSDNIDESSGSISDNLSNDDNDNDNDNDDAIRYKEIILAFFGDNDEAVTEELLSYIVDNGLASTPAEAMTVISKVNENENDELIEIDGADVYLNI